MVQISVNQKWLVQQYRQNIFNAPDVWIHKKNVQTFSVHLFLALKG